MSRDQNKIRIEFSPLGLSCLAFVFVEVFGGGSTTAIQRILGDSTEAARALEPIVRTQADLNSPYLELTEAQWRTMYESLNAVIYGLGPAELHILSSDGLAEVADLNLIICSKVWGAYRGDLVWDEVTIKRVETQ